MIRDLPKTQPTFTDQVKSALTKIFGAGNEVDFLRGDLGWHTKPGGIIYVDSPSVLTVQEAVNLVGPYGGAVQLGPGTYAGDVTLSVASNANVMIRGAGADASILSGNITVNSPNICIEHLTVRATGKSYGIKIINSGGVARCNLHRVVIGGSSTARTDGPDDGLYLDGAIITVADHCVFANCNRDGLHVDTSVAADSTNVNTFRDCTFNANGRYGVNLTAGLDGVEGMMLHRFEGGNIEDNVTTDFKADSCTFILIRGIDFETTQTHSGGQIVDISSSQPVVLEDCNFVIGGGATVTRFFQFSNCANGVVRRNRLSAGGGATWTQGAVGVFSEGCVQCRAYDNLLTGAGVGRYINNRGSNRGSVA